MFGGGFAGKFVRGGVQQQQQHQQQQSQQQQRHKNPSPLKTGSNKSWLLRLFESKLFDASMAMAYLFNSKVGWVTWRVADLKQLVKVSKRTRNTRSHPAADVSISYYMLALEFLSEFRCYVTVLSSFRVAVNSIEFSYEFLFRNRACSATSATSCSPTATPSLTSTCRRWSTCTSCTTRWQRSSTPTSYTGEQEGFFCLPIGKNENCFQCWVS